MSNKDFFAFLTEHETPPQRLKRETKKDISLSFRGKSIISKFILFQLIGAAFSMTVCPQFGMGLVEGHGITHTFRMIGDWACAAFCGTIFLSSGMLVAFISLPGEELWWLWRRYKVSLFFLPACLWSLLMLSNISLKLPGETLLYHATWILVAMVVEVILFKIRCSLVEVRLS